MLALLLNQASPSFSMFLRFQMTYLLWTRSFHTRPLQHLLPLHYTIPEPNQENCPGWPHLRTLVMRRDLCFETTPVTNTFNDTSHESRTVQHAHFLGHANIRVHQRVVVCDHVLVWSLRRDGVFERICWALEKETPERPVDKM